MLLLALVPILSGCTPMTPSAPSTRPAAWTRLPSLPDRQGFAGAFAGVSDGALLLAGGSNFPQAKPWQGGKKAWYDTVFVLAHPGDSWRIAGRLPHPLGYGVSITHRDGVICVGGSDGARHYADAFRLSLHAGRLVVTDLPPLPRPLANACGAAVGDTLYVAGGQHTPDATATSTAVFRIDLMTPNPRWQELPPLPSGRMLATAATFDGAFYVLGGVDLSPGPDGKPRRLYLADACRYDPARGWRPIAHLPHPVAAAPTPAPSDATGISLLGGDDGSQLETPPDQHPGFDDSLLHYDARADRWTTAGRLPAPRVTTPCVRWNDAWIIPSGEARPGVRSPEIWYWSPRFDNAR
jgi:N-acetylneuraminic acid mutarotase